MKKQIVNIIKRIVISGFSLFAFNLMAVNLNINIPINLITIIFITIFGILGVPFLAIIVSFFF